MSNKDANGGATPTRQSTSVQSASSSMSGATPRHSLLPSPDTSAMIIDDLAYDSGSDDEMSIEAKRVLKRKKLEREKTWCVNDDDAVAETKCSSKISSSS